MNNEKDNKIIQMKNLIEQLNKYSYEYYTLGEPTITDDTYDKLFDKLVLLEKETDIIFSNSPTQKVGNKILNELNKTKHEFPLLSLDKTKSLSELIKWIDNKDSVLMLKLDGLTIDLTYENGKLIKGETRGNGIEGEDITHNVKTFTNIPLNIQDKKHIHIVGEAIITKDIFDKLNKLCDYKYKNCRNLVSGSVRQLDNKICKQREVKFIAYNLLGTNIVSKHKQLQYLQQLGFDIVPHKCINMGIQNNKEYLQKFIDEIKTFAENNKIPFDGMVVTYNDIKYGESLGTTSHHPKHSLAFKFNDDVEITKLKDVQWQVGRTGIITPVAIFDEVELEGTTVKKASVHNLKQLNELQLGIGDEISVYKANQIIPQIKDNLTKTNTIKPPKNCPICNSPTEIITSDNSSILYCSNPNCKARLIQTISHYVSRKGLNIEGLSEKTIEKFIELNIINSIQDIYRIPKNENKIKDIIINQEGMGIKSYNKLVQAIDKSKKCKLENFIYGLGIPNVGSTTAKNIVDFCKKDTSLETLNNIFNTKYEKWLRMKDCGEILAKNLINYFSNPLNLKMINQIVQNELVFIEDNTKNKSCIFNNMNIYATGKFLNYKKEQIKQIIEENGGRFANGFSLKLDLLIVGSVKGSSKVQKAIDNNIKVMSEEDFTQLFN